jgi:hypothetical protein
MGKRDVTMRDVAEPARRGGLDLTASGSSLRRWVVPSTRSTALSAARLEPSRAVEHIGASSSPVPDPTTRWRSRPW